MTPACVRMLNVSWGKLGVPTPFLNYDSARHFHEGWFVRGNDMVRLFAHQPIQMRDLRPGQYSVSLQPYQDGIVKAWSPLYSGWLTMPELEAMAANLVEEGWQYSRFRPGPSPQPSPLLALPFEERARLRRLRRQERDRLRKQQAYDAIRKKPKARKDREQVQEDLAS